MYGSSLKESCECDMLSDGLFDLREIFISFTEHKKHQEDPASFDERVREKLIPRYMGTMERQLKSKMKDNEVSFLLGKKLNYADVALLEVLELLEETYPGLVKASYPLTAAFHQHLREMERIKSYLNSDRRNPPLNTDYIDHVRQVLDRK